MWGEIIDGGGRKHSVSPREVLLGQVGGVRGDGRRVRDVVRK